MDEGTTLSPELEGVLLAFCAEYDVGMIHHGTTLAMLYVTRLARYSPERLSEERLICPGGGQIAGLSAQRVRTILDEYGREDEWLGEAGRTNLSNCWRAIAYANILNQWYANPLLDYESVERWWLARLPATLIKSPRNLWVRPSLSIDTLMQSWAQSIKKLEREHPNHEMFKVVYASLISAVIFSGPENNIAKNLIVEVGHGERRDILISRDDAVIYVTELPTHYCLTSCQSYLEQRKIVYIVVNEEYRLVAQQMISESTPRDRIDVLSVNQVLTVRFAQAQLIDGHTRRLVWMQIVDDANAWVRTMSDRETIHFHVV